MLFGDDVSNDDCNRLEIERFPDPVGVDSVAPRRDAEVRRGEPSEIFVESASRAGLNTGLVAAILAGRREGRDVIARVEEIRLLKFLCLHPRQQGAVSVPPAWVGDSPREGIE